MLSFVDAARDGAPGIGDTISRKALAGVSACNAFMLLETEVSQTFQAFHHAAAKAHLRSQASLTTMSETNSQNSGFLKTWQALSHFIKTTCRAADHVATTISTKVCQPMVESVHGFQQLLNHLQITGTAENSPKRQTNDHPQGRELQRAKQRLALADEELQTAISSKESLISRFGSGLKPSLLEKTEERIARARQYRQAAQDALGALNSEHDGSKAKRARVAVSESKDRKSLTQQELTELDEFEKKRLRVLREGMRLTARSFFEFQRLVNHSLGSLVAEISAFDPLKDHQVWLAETLNVKVDEKVVGNPQFVATDEELASVGILRTEGTGATVGGPRLSEDVETLRDALKDRDAKISALSQENTKLRRQLESAQSNIRDLEQQLARGAAISPARSLSQKFSRQGSKLSGNIVIEESSVTEDSYRGGELGRLSRRTEDELDDGMSSSGFARQSSLNPMSGSQDFESSPPLRSTLKSKTKGDPFCDIPGSEYFPKLDKALTEPPIPAHFGPRERMLEVQRRFEEFLLCLKQFDLSSVTHSTYRWDDQRYNPGPSVDYGFGCYPIKVPGGVAMDVTDSSMRLPFALEFGAKRLDEFQWGCIAYETLLLCHEHLARIASIYQLLELPHRNIRLVTPEACSSNNSPSASLMVQPAAPISKFQRRRTKQRRHGTYARYAVSMAFAQEDLMLLRNLVTLCRLKMGIGSELNKTIVMLTLAGGSDVPSFGHWAGIHPLDVRWRVVRLLDSWVNADVVTDTGVKFRNMRGFNDWVLRQLHVVHCHVTFRLARIQKFLPFQTYDWLSDWTDRGPWYRLIAGRFPRFSDADALFSKGKLPKLLKLLEQCLDTLQGLTRAVDQNRWGEDIYSQERDSTDVYRNHNGITALFQQMTMIHALDKAFHEQIANDDLGDATSNYAGTDRRTSMGTVDSSTERCHTREGSTAGDTGGSGCDSTDTHVPKEFYLQNQILSLLTNNEQMVLSWPYEIPFLQLILALIWRTPVDSNDPFRLNINSRPLAKGVIIAATQLQVQEESGRLRSPNSFPGITLETHAMLLAQAMFHSVLETPAKGLLDFDFMSDLDDGGSSKSKKPSVVNEECLISLEMILREFVSWMEGGVLAYVQSPSVDALIQSKPFFTPLDKNSVLNTQRIMRNAPEDLNSAFGLPFENALVAQDFAVTDVRRFSIRKATSLETTSALMQTREFDKSKSRLYVTIPSRTEKLVYEILLRRLLGAQFLNEICSVLEDYHHRLDPASLPRLIACWEVLLSKLQYGYTPPDPLERSERDADDYDPDLPVTILLRGPHVHHDMYRHFIARTCRNLYARVFEDALGIVRSSNIKNEESESEPSVTFFSEALQTYIEEIRSEIEHYPSKWCHILPDNQHAVVVMHSCRQDLAESLSLLLNSGLWPDDDVPIGGTEVLAGIRSFETLENEVRMAVNIPLTNKPDLIEPFAGTVTAALVKRFARVEEIIERCVQTETWEPVDPPSAPHSVGIVDLFTFVSHAFDSIRELHAPIDWILPTFLKFLGRMVTQYTGFIKAGCDSKALLATCDRADIVFLNLHKPLAKVGGTGVSFGLNDVKKPKKGKGILGGWGLGGTKKKEKDALDVPASPMLVPPSSADDESEDNRTVVSATSKKKKRRKNAVSAESKELASRIGRELVSLLRDVSASFENSPMTHWLVRVHNLLYFSEQLPNAAGKLSELAMTRLEEKRDERSQAIQASLAEADKQARRRKRRVHDRLYKDDADASIARIGEVVMEVVRQCQGRVAETLMDVISFFAARIIYVELAPDVYEDLYCPTFEGNLTLESLTSQMGPTVFRLANALPTAQSVALQNAIVANLAKAWMLLLTEMGYAGHVFSEGELSVLDEDLEALKDFVDMNNLNPTIPLPNEESNQIQIFDHINDFFVLIASQPHCLAALGGNYEGGKRGKSAHGSNTKANVLASPTPREQGIDMLFEDGASAGHSPSPSVSHSVSSKKKKGFAAKFLKMKF